ncbi:CDGSH iron-sulfur domain-containing protein [Haloferax sp. DFSO52]|uniref:CDGSH iron-sulfur domain-containing protein n=1 Tax=Haloferax sp. DFSO52 TaxID=3388505 RepID=UPI003A860CE8
MEQDVHEYEGTDITVSFDVKRCIHARECVKGLPAVFDKNKRPWIEPENADADDLAAVITRCPTGALHFERKDGGWEETPDDENTIEVTHDGPLYVRGTVEITDEDGTLLLPDTRLALCRCGASENKPLCDNSHLLVDFEAPGSVSEVHEGGDTESSVLTVTPTRNGPLHAEGAFEIVGQDDGSWSSGDDEWLCRCGGSQNKPFCDNTHKKIGFTTEEA